MAAHAAQATGISAGKRRARSVFALLAVAVTLAACKNVPNRAPVEDHNVRAAPVAAASAPEAAKPAAPPAPAVDPHVQTYTVKPGDTLIRISLDTGTRVSDLARWNAIENPDRIEVGQVLKVSPPAGETVATTKPVPPSKVDARPLPPTGAASGSTSAAASPIAPASSAGASSASHDADADLQWAWPAVGAVTTPFDDGKNKGVNIAGKPGDPVYAAADGQVVYAGSGLYGYGNLVIVKHNQTYLTAYAFNRTLLVKEDQAVKRGQKIAEMGSTGSTERVQLHFEIRRLGKPIDPTQLLPGR
jgi:lipoprotein NlpD